MNYKISAIVPFLNEEEYLHESVNRLLKTNLFEKIILVDDGSTDGSNKIANAIASKFELIEVVELGKSKGKGNAVKVGLNYVNTSHVIIHDADLEYNPSDIPEMFEIAKLNPRSLVLGSRTLKGKKRDNKYKTTYYANKILTIFFSIINLYKVSDIASCYWLIETELLKKINIKEKRFAIEVEVLSKYLKFYSKIIEVPISYTGRLYSEGKKIKFSDGLMIFFKIIYYSKLNIFLKIRYLKSSRN